MTLNVTKGKIEQLSGNVRGLKCRTEYVKRTWTWTAGDDSLHCLTVTIQLLTSPCASADSQVCTAQCV